MCLRFSCVLLFLLYACYGCHLIIPYATHHSEAADGSSPTDGGKAIQSEPVRSSGSPSGVLPIYTTVVQLSLATDIPSQCRFDVKSETSYHEMEKELKSSDGIFHHTLLYPITPGKDYIYHVRCKASNGKENQDDYTISFQPLFPEHQHFLRSVGPKRSAPLAIGANNPLEVKDEIAFFALPLPKTVGIGDILQYDSDGDGKPDHLAMVTSRAGDLALSLKGADGSTSLNTNTKDTSWSLFRAYTSLAAAVNNTPNPNIDSSLMIEPHDFYQLSLYKNSLTFVCYADAVDTSSPLLTSAQWLTSTDYRLSIYVPWRPTEVGVSQRHDGRWQDGAYTLSTTTETEVAISVNAVYVDIEGAQFSVVQNLSGAPQRLIGIRLGMGKLSANISSSIFKGPVASNKRPFGIYLNPTNNEEIQLVVWNSIFYDFKTPDSDGTGIYSTTPHAAIYAYNNTFVDNDIAIDLVFSPTEAINNLFSGCQKDMNGKTFVPTTNFNATDNLSFSPTIADTDLKNNRVNQRFIFRDRVNDDFRLSIDDTAARDHGTAITLPPITTDIQGETRKTPADIGADEATAY